MRNLNVSYIVFLVGVLFCFQMNLLMGMEKLLIIEPSKENPRSSEGDIIELKDEHLCLVYTRFTGGSGDDSRADLAMRTSKDGGKTWSGDHIILKRQDGLNVMSVSLLRLQDRRIALFYLQKTSTFDCRPVMLTSADEGKTWDNPTECITDEVGYYVLNNDRAVQLKTGRLILPVAWHNKPGQDPDWQGILMCYLSDDNGKTWRRSRDTFKGKLPEGKRMAVQEPGIVELKDGRLMMYIRSDGGSQYISYSKDEGETWSETQPSDLASPLSPATIERMPWNGDLMCVWNDHSGDHPFPSGRRTPLCVAVSKDDGKTWSKSIVLEGNPDGWYCYISITFVKGQAILSYCAGDKKVGGLNRLKVLSLPQSWFEKNLYRTRKAPTKTDIFISGQDNYNIYRIPGLIVTRKGTVLAFSEGREGGDQTPTDMVLKRSFDNGATWGSLQVAVAHKGIDAIMNPCPVIDQSDGTIFLLCNLFPDEMKSEHVPGAVRQLVVKSTDDGATWSEPVDITDQVTDPETWAAIYSGPGVAIQTTDGRLVIPSSHHEGGDNSNYINNVFFSNDHGLTWSMGQNVAGFADEAQVVELVDGSLMLNVRSSKHCGGFWL